jgi:O-antigen ligase
MGAWGIALCLTSPVTIKTKWVAALAACFSLALLYALIPDFFHSLIERGSTHRIDIWTATTKTLDDAPLFGKGINLKFVDTELSKSLVPVTGLNIQHPHNLGLSTWLYSGLTGVILLFATTISAPLIMAKKNVPALVAAAPVIITVLFLSLTDLSKLIAPPSAIWFIFWFPFAFIAGLSHREKIKEHGRYS